jgi:hypothetical protein
MKHYISVLILLISINLSAQIYIGQPIKEVLYILKSQCKPKDCKIEKKSFDGHLDQIIVSKYNQLYYELGIRTDATDYYFTEDGKYISKETELPEIFYLQLKKLFDRLYGSTKIDEYYFTDDFSHYQFITSENGITTITYAKTNLNSLSKSLRTTITQRKLEQNKKVNKEDKVLKKVRNDYVLIDDYVDSFTERTTKKLISHLKGVSYLNRLGTSTFNLTIEIRLYADRNKKYSKIEVIKPESQKKNVHHLFENQLIRLPEAIDIRNGKIYKRNRETYLTFHFDFEVGKMVLRKKRKGIEFPENYSLTEKQKNVITKYLQTMKNGKYLLEYRIGTINDTDITTIKATKIRSKVGLYLQNRGF